MATRNIKPVKTEIPAPDESSGSGASRSELAAQLQLPISVGNPEEAESLAIDQAHMEEFATAEEKSPDVRYGRPPKGHYLTVRAETAKPWADRAFYFLLEIEGRDPYIVVPSIAKQKTDEDLIRPILVCRYITMAGTEGLWPIKVDKPDARSNRWNKSALTALEEAGKFWIRLISAEGHYRYKVSRKTLEQAPPKFSNRSFTELIDIAFKDRIIRSLDHGIWEELDSGSEK